MLIEERARPEGALGLTHVLVIGVGEYPWLDGGDFARGEEVTDGMTQLDSPPVSARDFASWWLANYEDPERPLGSLRMLLSDRQTRDYLRPDGTVVTVPLATIDAVRQAADQWSALGMANEEDQMVFFFSGHGIAGGVRQALLVRDYGENERRPMLGAIDLDGLLRGMECLVALRQMIFIDACRMASQVLVRNTTETGDVLLPSGEFPTTGMMQNLYFASLNGRAAYGRDGDTSLFTRALLNAFKGAGAHNTDDEAIWRLGTGRVAEALRHFSTPLGDPVHGRAQLPQMGRFTPYDFHRFAAAPEIPVYFEPWGYVGNMPAPELRRLSISFDEGELVGWASPWHASPDCSWEHSQFEMWLVPDRKYIARVTFGNGDEVAGGRHVTSPYGVLKVDRHG